MDVLLIGASVRAAAASLQRIGWRPIAFDLFADLDLAAACQAHRLVLDDYPSKIWERVAQLPVMPWIYTGALENHPSVVAAISRRFRLLGNGPAVLRQVKDPIRLADVVRGAGFPAPAVRECANGIPTVGSWLEKPIASGGGEGIRIWRGQASPGAKPAYYQQKVAGISLAATFVRDGTNTRLVGVSRQYHGRSGHPFAYRGSLGPWPLVPAFRSRIDALGRTVGDSFDLRGIFGIDLIESNGQPWLIEVNPRYTASVEVLEYALNRSIMADHVQAFEGAGRPIAEWDSSPSTAIFVAKRILFARTSGDLDEAIPVERSDVEKPRIADIPQLGTHFDAGQPVMTVFGWGETVAACRFDLVRQIRSWKTRIAVLRGE